MSGLKSLIEQKKVVETPGGPLPVRGLSMTDLLPIFNQYRTELSMLFDAYAAGGLTTEDPKALSAKLMTELPDISLMLIAAAAGDGSDDEDDLAIAARLPFPVQVEILEAIGSLTFASEAALKKFAETVLRVLQGMTKAVTNLQP